jgi:hypothetical protein
MPHLLQKLTLFPFLFLLTSLVSFNASALEYSISKQEIQARVDEDLPTKEKIVIGTVILNKATVDLLGDVNEISLDLTLTVDLLGKKYNGTALVQSGVDYNQKKGAFYLTRLKIQAFEIEEMSKDMAKQVEGILKQVLKAQQTEGKLQKYPIYTIKNKSTTDKLLKATLKSIRIENDKVVVIVSPF